MAFANLHRPSVSHYLPWCKRVFSQKYPKISSSGETLLWQKQLIPAPFYLKGISLLLIWVTLFFLPTIPSCMSAVGEGTSKPETSYLMKTLLLLFSKSPNTRKFCCSFCFLSFFRFFHFRFLAYWDQYHKFAGFDSFKLLKKY